VIRSLPSLVGRGFRTLLGLVCCAGVASAQVALHTVDDDGPADFADLQLAIDAAAPGDVVLVAPGQYEPAVLAGKGLSIVATSSASLFDSDLLFGEATPDPVLTLRDIPVGQSAVVSGFTVFNSAPGPESDLLVHDCDGVVWLQQLFLDSYGVEAFAAREAAALVLVDVFCQTNLVSPLPDGTPWGGAGARFGPGTVAWCHDVHAGGSHGAFLPPGSPPLIAAPPGGPGAVVDDAVVSFTGSAAGGNSGGSATLDGCVHGGDGGAGIVLSGAAPSVTLRDTNYGGGFGGFFDRSCAPPTQMGPQLDGDPADLTVLPGEERRLLAPTAATVGETISLGLHGEAGETALFFLAGAQAPGVHVGGVDLHLQLTSLTLLAAVPMAADGIDVSVTVPPLPGGFEVVTVPLQAVFLDGAGGRAASNPWAIIAY